MTLRWRKAKGKVDASHGRLTDAQIKIFHSAKIVDTNLAYSLFIVPHFPLFISHLTDSPDLTPPDCLLVRSIE
jgi:hypothetical protein